MVANAELGKSRREVYRITKKEVSMDAIQRTINLRAGQYIRYAKRHTGRRPHTRNVTFPSLKKYLSCCTNNLSGVVCLPLVLSSRNLGKLACLASNPALGRRASETGGDIFQSLSVSENVESNETIEVALDRTGDV